MSHSIVRPRRSFIFTPGLKPEMYPKAFASDTGLVVIDGKLIEKPVLRDMYRIVAIADRTERKAV